MDASASELRTIRPSRLWSAATKCLSEAQAHLTNKKYALAIPFLEILENLPLGCPELAMGLCEQLWSDVFCNSPNRQVKSLTDAIAHDWQHTWETYNVPRCTGDRNASPIPSVDITIGALVMLDSKVPKSCNHPPGSIVTVIDICGEQFVRVIGRTRGSAKINRKFCIPCRGSIRNNNVTVLTRWAFESLNKSDPVDIEEVGDLCSQLAREGLHLPHHLADLSTDLLRDYRTDFSMRSMDLLHRLVVVAHDEFAVSRRQELAIASSTSVDQVISRVKRLRDGETLVPLVTLPVTRPALIGEVLTTNFTSWQQTRQWFQTVTNRLRLFDIDESTLGCYTSALNAWAKFVDACALMKGEPIPHIPAEAELVYWWQATIHHPDTASNYLTALKKGHQWANREITWDDKICKSIRKGTSKFNPPKKRPRHAISRDLLKKLVTYMRARSDHEMADLCIIAYNGAFRVQSELLPATFSRDAQLWTISEDNSTTIELPSRKNRKLPSKVIRDCTCSVNPDLCIHLAVERRLKSCIRQQRTKIWTLMYHQAMQLLRSALTELGTPDAHAYGLHAFRRGIAQDLMRADTPIRDILAACDWRSSAFEWYLARENIDNAAVLRAASALSDEDE